MTKRVDDKKVSIILPTYNGSRYIREAIESCLNQIYKNFELIIVDDGSTDGIKNIIKSYNDERIKYFRHEHNLGLAEALNTGFTNATGIYLAWTSDDNLYDLKAIEFMVQALEQDPGLGFVYANYYIINEQGKKIKDVKTGSVKSLDRHNCIGPCFLYRRKVYEQIGGYNPNFFLAEDYEYWLRIRKQFRMQRLDKFLYFYREHTNSLTTKHKIALIEEQAEKASQKYVTLWAKYYHKGRVHLFNKDYKNSMKFFIRALFLSPFNFFIWKMILFTFLNILFYICKRKK